MKAETWVKTIILSVVLVLLCYSLGKVLALLQENIRSLDLLDPSLAGWGKLALTLLVAVAAVASWVGVVAVLVRPMLLNVAVCVLAALATVCGWQGSLIEALSFLTRPLAIGGVLVLATTLAIYATGVAADVGNRIKFSLGSLASRLTLLLLGMAALVALVFYLGILEQTRNITLKSLLDNPNVEKLIAEAVTRFVPREAVEGMPSDAVGTLKEEITQKLGARIEPYLKHIPAVLALSLFQILIALTVPVSWICPWVSGGLLSLLRLIGVVKVRRGPVVIERLSLEEGDFSDEVSS